MAGSTGVAAEHDGAEPADTEAEAEATGPIGAAGTSTPAEGGAGSDSDDHDGADLRDSGSPSPSPSRFGGRWRTAAFAAAVAVLLLGGSAFFYGAHHLRSTPSAQNRALTDTAATERVSGEVSDGLARIFSYTPTGADATERSARLVLAGRAARQYGDLFAQLRANLETQKITLSTQAVRTGVIELDGNTARLLVLLDQTSRRDEGATTSSAAQLTVTAQFHGDRWQIVDIKAR
ncbi:hypothetical protein OHA37_38215 [Streptomyces sp. NBC_00335]|uniref:hypothetical protein n=1 Tax=unclassified Streptomyces TaxID=2593676 RepID=UPI0022532681|nr:MULTISPECIES: hypothetical protein [unclassified Streptomyces]MCX5409681.1 hypothetical protein [Streptomyces sp. NBC_00086]